MKFAKNEYELYELYEPKIFMTHMNFKPWNFEGLFMFFHWRDFMSLAKSQDFSRVYFHKSKMSARNFLSKMMQECQNKNSRISPTTWAPFLVPGGGSFEKDNKLITEQNLKNLSKLSNHQRLSSRQGAEWATRGASEVARFRLLYGHNNKVNYQPAGALNVTKTPARTGCCHTWAIG